MKEVVCFDHQARARFNRHFSDDFKKKKERLDAL